MSVSDTSVCSCCSSTLVNKKKESGFYCCVDFDLSDYYVTVQRPRHLNCCDDCVCVLHIQEWLPKQPIKMCCIQRASTIYNNEQVVFKNFRKKVDNFYKKLYDNNDNYDNNSDSDKSGKKNNNSK